MIVKNYVSNFRLNGRPVPDSQLGRELGKQISNFAVDSVVKHLITSSVERGATQIQLSKAEIAAFGTSEIKAAFGRNGWHVLTEDSTTLVFHR